ncbi:MAG: ribose 5-phosphate isomerase B [Planctomycetota bacterium]
MRRVFLTEADVLRARDAGTALVVPPGAELTPAARDTASLHGVALVGEGASVPSSIPAPPQVLAVALGCDHGGLDLKRALKAHIESLGYRVEDVGTHSADAVDYPDIAEEVGRRVSEGRCARGVVIDAAGIGSAIAANKVPGVRAANCRQLAEVENSRKHNDANVLSLGARFVQPSEAKDLVRVFLSTAFEGGRHLRRVEKVGALERKFQGGGGR